MGEGKSKCVYRMTPGQKHTEFHAAASESCRLEYGKVSSVVYFQVDDVVT